MSFKKYYGILKYLKKKLKVNLKNQQKFKKNNKEK